MLQLMGPWWNRSVIILLRVRTKDPFSDGTKRACRVTWEHPLPASSAYRTKNRRSLLGHQTVSRLELSTVTPADKT